MSYIKVALLLILASCLSASSERIAGSGFIVFSNHAYSYSDRSPISRRIPNSGSVPSTEPDLQRPQTNEEPMLQTTWNRMPTEHHQDNNLPPSAAGAGPRPSASDSAPGPAPARPPVAATAEAAAPAQPITTVVQGVDRPRPALGPTRPPAVYNFRERFSSVFFQRIASNNPQSNVIYSPESLHSMLAMLYGVSSGETEEQLRRVGQFHPNQTHVALNYQRVRHENSRLQNAQLIVASKLYFNQELSPVNKDFPAYGREYFGLDIQAVDMKSAANTAARINVWALDATRQKIRNLVKPSDITPQTQAMLVNAIYFKARWETEFSAMDTVPEKFQVNSNQAIRVSMMFNDDIYSYAELPELDARVLELPYVNSEASMLIILPNQVDGLPQLERKLVNADYDLNVIASQLRRESVTVRLPKFRIEFEQDMVNPLQQLGVTRMFTGQSEVDAMLSDKVRVSKILQKAFIDVNEAGSEAAAATYAKFVPLSLPIKSLEFFADHPFMFAIRTAESVLFIGHVVQPTPL